MDRLTIDEVIEHCRRTCENTELLASARGQKQDDITSKNYWEHYQVEEWLKELKQYRDAEEQGLLLKLPCKVGDTVYILAGRYGTFYEEDICDGFYIGRYGLLQVKVQNHKGNHGTYGVVGKTVFLTKAEAEQHLAEVKKIETERLLLGEWGD